MTFGTIQLHESQPHLPVLSGSLRTRCCVPHSHGIWQSLFSVCRVSICSSGLLVFFPLVLLQSTHCCFIFLLLLCPHTVFKSVLKTLVLHVALCIFVPSVFSIAYQKFSMCMFYKLELCWSSVFLPCPGSVFTDYWWIYLSGSGLLWDSGSDLNLIFQ